MTTTLTVQQYRQLESKIKQLEDVIASLSYRNSTLAAQEASTKSEVLRLQQKLNDAVGEQTEAEWKINHPCSESQRNGVRMFDCTKSASKQEPPAWAINMGLVEVDYGQIQYEQEQQAKQQRLKSAATKKYHWTDSMPLTFEGGEKQ